MGLETPLALLALVAAALPVLAHLLRRQDLPRRKLPTIALLRRAETSSRRRVRVVDLLLLITRVAIVVAVVLALAGPFFRVTLAYGDGAVASLAVVVDDSMSMETGDPSALAAATGRAADVIDSLRAGSEVAVVLGGAPARVLVSRTEDLEAARRALERIEAGSARGTDLGGALEAAEHELAGARHAERRVLVLSDLAAHASVSDRALPSGVQLRFERIGEGRETRNAAIVAARAEPDPTTPGMSSIAVELRASADFEGEVPLVLSRGGEELARERVELGGGGARVTLHARVSPDDPAGLLTLEVDDAIEADDRRGVLLRPPSGARVVIVEGDRGRQPQFLARAIDLAPEEGGALRRRSVDPDTFATMDLSDAEVVVLADAPAPTRATARVLREHVERGGGLLIAPGEHFDARGYAAVLGDLLPARPRAPVSGDWAGPVAAPGGELVPAGSSGLEQTRTRRRIELERVDASAHTLLAFGDGSPALLSVGRGDGTVALMATSLEDAWTDLPFRPGYLPMVVHLVRELAPRASTPDTALAPGTPLTLRPPAGATRFVVIEPDGTENELGDTAVGGLEDDLVFDATERAGVYRVRVATRDRGLAEEPRMAFLIAPPAEESDLSPGPVPEGAEAEPRERRGAVVERPFARWLFLLVGLLALLEAGLRLRVPRLARA